MVQWKLQNFQKRLWRLALALNDNRALGPIMLQHYAPIQATNPFHTSGKCFHRSMDILEGRQPKWDFLLMNARYIILCHIP